VAVDGGGGALSLGAARKEFLEAQTTKREAVDGTRELTIKELAQAYNRDVLSQRERAAEAWNVLRVHIVEAQADPAAQPSANGLRRRFARLILQWSSVTRRRRGRSTSGVWADRVWLASSCAS